MGGGDTAVVTAGCCWTGAVLLQTPRALVGPVGTVGYAVADQGGVQTLSAPTLERQSRTLWGTTWWRATASLAYMHLALDTIKSRSTIQSCRLPCHRKTFVRLHYGVL